MSDEDPWEHPGRRLPGEDEHDWWKRGRDMAYGRPADEIPDAPMFFDPFEGEDLGLGTFNPGNMRRGPC